MSNASWKCLERKAAKALGGKRISRGDDFSRKDGDVDHPLFQIECKWGKQVPKFFYDALEQAKGYGEKCPLVVAQRKGKGPLVCMTLKDFEDHFGGVI